MLAEIAPLPERPEKVRQLDAASTEIRVTLNAETLAVLDHIKTLISHARPNATYAQVIEYLAKLGVKKLDPQAFTPSRPVPAPALTPFRRAVWQRDQGQCTYLSPGGKNCGSKKLLQIDHIIPRAKGGPNTLDNLRLRCRAHNLLTAVEEFGEANMSRYTNAKLSSGKNEYRLRPLSITVQDY